MAFTTQQRRQGQGAECSPRFALTTGEPAGIGPDLAVALAAQGELSDCVLLGDVDLLKARAKQLGYDVAFETWPAASEDFESSKHTVWVKHIPLKANVTPGQLAVDNASYVLALLDEAIAGCQQGAYAGVVTAPIHKGVICDAGHAFSGHTEYFAEQLAADCPVMLLTSPQLKVALLTTHIPLSAVADAVTAERLKSVIRVLARDGRRYFTNNQPLKIGVCGLNPHAGESGHLGLEEINVINPTLAQLREEGIHISDALPADTIFVPAHAKAYDVILAMYHDQGLSVIKSQGFGQCVNITLGLPVIRTSVDHGTALPLAGTGQADASSLRMALTMAKSMQASRQRQLYNQTTH